MSEKDLLNEETLNEVIGGKDAGTSNSMTWSCDRCDHEWEMPNGMVPDECPVCHCKEISAVLRPF